MEEQNNETKKIMFESATLFKELIEKNQFKRLKSVSSKPYPIYCFGASEGVMRIVSDFMVRHNMRCDRTTDGDIWKSFDSDILNAETKPNAIVTRNLRVVSRATSEGYGYLLSRTCVDQHKKKTFVFHYNERIAEIKAEEDLQSKKRYEEKIKENAHTINLDENKKKSDIHMSRLIKKAMEEKN